MLALLRSKLLKVGICPGKEKLQLLTTCMPHKSHPEPPPIHAQEEANGVPMWQPRVPRPDGSVEPLEPGPAIFVVYQFLKQRGFNRAAGLLEVDAREELDKMKHLEGQDIDLPELLDEYWFLTSCEERRNQLCEQNPFAEDLFRMLDAHMGINPWQNSLPKPQSYMRSAEEEDSVSREGPDPPDVHSMPSYEANQSHTPIDTTSRYRVPDANPSQDHGLPIQPRGKTDTSKIQTNTDSHGQERGIPPPGRPINNKSLS